MKNTKEKGTIDDQRELDTDAGQTGTDTNAVTPATPGTTEDLGYDKKNKNDKPQRKPEPERRVDVGLGKSKKKSK